MKREIGPVLRHGPRPDPELDSPRPGPVPPALAAGPPPQLGAEQAAAVMMPLQRGHGNAAVARAIAASGTGERRLARQPAASPTKPVPLPGWGDPLTGDDTSFALFTPWAAHRPGNHAGPMSMGTFDQDGGLTGTISVKATNGNSGEVWLVVDDSFSLDGEGIVVHRFRGDWRYAIKNRWGDLEITGGNGRLVSTQGYATDDDDVKLTAIESAVEGNIVQIKATFTGTSSSSSPVSVGFQGKKGQSVGGSLGSSKASAAGGMTAVFRLRIVVEDAVQGPRDLPYRSHKYSIHYDEGKHLLDGPQTVGLADFLKSHQKVVEMLTSTDVASEDAKVRISAFASPKGRPQDNLDLAEARANEVRRRLTQLGVRPQNIVHTRSPGELGGPTKGEPAGDEATRADQRVDIEIREAVATE